MKEEKKDSTLFIRIDSKMYNELARIAEKEYRTKSSIVKQAVSEFLKSKRSKA